MTYLHATGVRRAILRMNISPSKLLTILRCTAPHTRVPRTYIGAIFLFNFFKNFIKIRGYPHSFAAVPMNVWYFFLFSPRLYSTLIPRREQCVAQTWKLWHDSCRIQISWHCRRTHSNCGTRLWCKKGPVKPPKLGFYAAPSPTNIST